MGFSNLLFLWAIILPVIVLIYYFFRKKYKDQPISSTLFWNSVMQETKVSPYLKHLQKNALLYLQLLALLLFILALINPYFKKSEVSGEQIIWIVDTSASMLAGKETSTFENHKQKMRLLVSEIEGRPLTIITTGEEPNVIIRQETDTTNIHKAINDLSVTYEEEKLTKSIDVAQAFVGDISTSIYLFTDSVERNELPIESEHIKWIVYGAEKNLKNIAITKFAATEDGKTSIALVQLKNDWDIEQNVILSIFDENDEVLIEEKLSLDAYEERSLMYEQLVKTNILTVNIEVSDDYSVDNTMSTVIGGGLSEIIIDQQMHGLVQKGFQSLNAEVKIAPSDQLKSMSNEGIIVSNQTELLESTARPIVLIGRDDETALEVSNLVNVSNDPLFAFSSLEDVYVSTLYPPFEDFETIASIGEQPFIQRSNRGDIVILADIESTDWPLHPSFPLFLWSLQNEFSVGAQSLGSFSPNEARSISLTNDIWTIYSSDDEYIGTIENVSQFTAPFVPGVYKIQSENDEKNFVVQLAIQERLIREGTSFELGEFKNEGEAHSTKESLSVWILLTVLLLLVTEWEVQRRRGFAN